MYCKMYSCYLLFAVFYGTSQVVEIIPLEGDNADHTA
jgi:hypothetical protein